MAKHPPPSQKPATLEALQREALINGEPPPASQKPAAAAEFVLINERHGIRWLRVSMISQVVRDRGQVGGPWFVRCDAQQLPVSEATALEIMGLLNLNLEEKSEA